MSTPMPTPPARHCRTVAALVLAVVATLTTACSADPTDPASGCLPGVSPSRQPLVLAVSSHANSPKPDLPAPVVTMVESALVGGQPVHLVAVDGTPALVTMPALPAISDATCNALKASATSATNAVVTAVRRISADTDGDNLYGAVALVSDMARSEDWDRASLVLLDSGLTDETSSPVVMAQDGMLGADPDEVANFARQAAPLNLKRLDVALVSFGYSAPPQEPLDETGRKAVTAIWRSVLTRQGAEVTVLPHPRPEQGPDTALVTAVTPVPEPDVFTPPAGGETTTIVYRDSGPVRFEPNSTELVDPEAAARAVEDLAAWLAAAPTHHALVTGTTSSAGTADGRLELSRARAARIRDLLLSAADVAPDQVDTQGVGNDFSQRVNDRNAAGELVPALAARNRTVRIAVSDTTNPPADTQPADRS